MSRIAPKVRALALVIIAAAGFALGAPAASAQEDPEVSAAQAAFDAKDYARASTLYGPLCARGVGWACAEQNRALFNLGEQQRACPAPQSVAVCTDRANRSAATFEQVCASSHRIAQTPLACDRAQMMRLAARGLAVGDLTTPPTPDGCLQIDAVRYVASFSCERDVSAMHCFVAKATPDNGCINVGETGMGWGTFAPGSPPDAKRFAFYAATPGAFDVFWYECYGLGARFNEDTAVHKAVAFDPRTGWRNVRCYTRDGAPTAPVFRTSLSPGPKGPIGR